ncbi:hypothetical protein PV371_25095 [Streptomyces sp. TX20-6-3]|uniref:hypothetical protein n=1 Tax=Streptomyces sp. TX20-6-3 TaxID=3028705 RepID=UPI0029AD1706|nr:hypothetical protein [Streptomyces sp. TX20-6-3]MDX2562910.1 hypothetical protein [Streptomyces sp. TX20-6-3]
MVNVSVTSSVMIEDGPVLSLAMNLDPESYTVASVTLDAGGSRTVGLSPESGSPILLAVRATTESGNDADVSLQPNPDISGDAPTPDPQDVTPQPLQLKVQTVLLISGAEVLQSIGTPRSLGVTNHGTEPVTVDILACLDLPDEDDTEQSREQR